MTEFKPKEIMEDVYDEVRDIGQAMAQRILASVVLSTPIGRPDLWLRPAPKGYRPGTARGNWRVTIGEPPQAVELPIQDPVGATTIGVGEQTISLWDGRSRLNIQNAAGHIVPLDDGTASRQTNGANFVARATVAGIASLDGTRREI